MAFTRLAIAAIAIVAWTINLSGQDNKSPALTEHKENDERSQWVFFQYIGQQAPAPKTASADAHSPHWYTLPEWWLFILGVPTLFIFGWQAFETRRAAEATRDSVDLMERQAEEARGTTAQQTRDVQASIAEATRAATAMEGIAESMASNVESVRTSVGISREIADMQKLATELQSRAYLSVFFDESIYQDANHVFGAQATIRNHGNTPAYDIAFRAVAQIVPVPFPEDFDFLLPQSSAGVSGFMAPGTTKLIRRDVSSRVPDDHVDAIKRGGPPHCLAMWGEVTYLDAFRQARYTRFAFTIDWIPWLPGMGKDKDGNQLPPKMMSHDTTRHNEAN
jgi:hypothetical protein